MDKGATPAYTPKPALRHAHGSFAKFYRQGEIPVMSVAKHRFQLIRDEIKTNYDLIKA